ncbi:HNH endonuclease signature motif containing protein [Agrococcus sp. DT81.2]|uniref:HNH endonuclease signature motif containing protein n=1 Tax=Agrococcus sp. DT81.2 TaxID=3393414 RepID=UPI003CE47F33
MRVQFEGKSRVVRVHHLVLEAFVGPRPDGMFGCHWNDDPYDNRLENLRWATPSANSLDSVRNRTHAAATRTACPRGHEYTPSNTYVYTNRDGRQTRSCRACKTTSSREWARRRNQAKTSEGQQ